MDTEDQNLLFHLKALRQMLIHCLCALALGLVPMFALSPFVLDQFLQIITNNTPITLNYFAPLEVFILELKLALLLDFAFCFPYIAWQLWLFVAPALYENERHFALKLIGAASFLFVCGACFGLLGIVPMLLKFGLSFSSANLKPLFGLENVLSLSAHLSFVFGLMFQLPLITYALIKNNIITPESVKNKRPYILVGILVLSALFTPPDIISQLLLATPSYLLFEGGLWFATRDRWPS